MALFKQPPQMSTRCLRSSPWPIRRRKLRVLRRSSLLLLPRVQPVRLKPVINFIPLEFSFAFKETRSRYIYHFRMGDDTTETRKAGPSRIWKRALGVSVRCCSGRTVNPFIHIGMISTIPQMRRFPRCRTVSRCEFMPFERNAADFSQAANVALVCQWSSATTAWTGSRTS